MSFFQNSVISKYIKALDKQVVSNAYSKFKEHFHNSAIQENIRNSKEEQYQGEFLIDLFVSVLGYTKNPTPNFNLTTEYKNLKDSKKADGAIIIKDVVKAVIELKGTNTTDLNKIETQAFGYKNNQPECEYIITSNFEKLRFYIDNAIEYIEFNLFTLTDKEFELLYVCLAFENIEKGLPKKIKSESVSQEDTITKKLYHDYSVFKKELYHNLVALNPQYQALDLFKISQKLLDRFLFIFFAEDRALLPTNLIFRINKEWQQLREMRIEVSLYDRYKIYFHDLNVGATVSLPAFNETKASQKEEFQIFAYNGGLFHTDDILNAIKIDDAILFKHTENLSNYDFSSEVDVNILGHIFENSLNELDELKAQVEGQEVDKTKTKRKKDGVFYTPKYITKYIVENTIGKLCQDKKAELQINDEDYFTDKKRQKNAKQALSDKLTQYRNWLLQLTICDPACGSGAFLNQALDFLIAEHRYIDELHAKLFGDAMVLSDIEKSILENNLFGVDINEESVEIAKLSLWLRTAQPNRKLNDLNDNIKCGNSLIDDESIAGDKAFNWERSFPKIFEKGGFDAVIGNPPYVPGKSLEEKFKNYVKKEYQLLIGKYDLYLLFMEKIINIINSNGYWGLIIPNTVLVNENASLLRQSLLANKNIGKIRLFKDDVFPDASVESVVLISGKNINKIDLIDYKGDQFGNTDFETIKSDKFYRIQISISQKDTNVIQKIDPVSFKLGSIVEIGIGIQIGGSGNSDDFKEKYISRTCLNEGYKKFLDGKDFEPYIINWSGNYISYGDWLHRKRDEKYFLNEKIIIRQIGSVPVATIDKQGYYVLNTIYSLILKENSPYSIDFIFAVINSKILKYYWTKLFSDNKTLFPKIKKSQLTEIPVKKDISGDIQKQVEGLIFLNSKLNVELSNISKTFIDYFIGKTKIQIANKKLQNWYELDFQEFIVEINKMIKKSSGNKLTKIEEMDWMEVFQTKKYEINNILVHIIKNNKEIDQIFYKLYDLTEDEIKIVEGVE